MFASLQQGTFGGIVLFFSGQKKGGGEVGGIRGSVPGCVICIMVWPHRSSPCDHIFFVSAGIVWMFDPAACRPPFSSVLLMFGAGTCIHADRPRRRDDMARGLEIARHSCPEMFGADLGG